MFCLYYVIKRDTLYSISRKYNVDVNTIIMANPFINVYNLQPDITICLPVYQTTDILILRHIW